MFYTSISDGGYFCRNLSVNLKDSYLCLDYLIRISVDLAHSGSRLLVVRYPLILHDDC